MHFQSETIKVPHHYIVTIGFRALNWTSRETYKTGKINSIETTRLTRTETRHDFLVHGDLLQASLRGCQGWDSVLAPQQTLFVEHSNIHHARFKTKLVIGTPCVCNRKSFTRYLLKCELRFHCSLNLPYLNSVTKEAENVSLKLDESYLNIPSVSTTKRISKLKGRI